MMTTTTQFSGAARPRSCPGPAWVVPSHVRAWTRPSLRSRATSSATDTQFLTAPMRQEVAEVLATVESAPAPLWGTWCGTAAGLWVGRTAAFNPSTGLAEPIALAEDGRSPILEMAQCCVEERVLEGDGDCLVRHTARAVNETQLTSEMASAGNLRFDATASVDWDVESLAYGQEGLFIFDGGSYSAGPQQLGTVPSPAASAAEGAGDSGVHHSWDEQQEEQEEEEGEANIWDYESEGEEEEFLEEEEVRKSEVALIESCLQWNGEQRVRIRLTLASSGGASSGEELDVTLLRVAVCREAWEGLPGIFTTAQQPARERQAQQTSGQQRLRPAAVTGFFNEFSVVAQMVQDVDMRTGRPAILPVYSSSETQRLVSFAGDRSSGSGGRAEVEVEGGALWLPHNVAVQLAMVPTPEPGPSDLVVSMLWSPEDGLLLSQQRRYSHDGTLLDVVSSTAVRAS